MATELIEFMNRKLIFIEGLIPQDPELFDSLKEALLNMKDEDIYIDVGAFYGDTSVIIEKGTCYAFEPSSRNFKVLLENIKLNNSNVIPIQQALSNTKFKYKVKEINQSSFDFIEEGDENETTTIDEYFDLRYKNIKVIKIDAEGHDYKVFLGAKQTIKKHRPIVIVENNHLSGEDNSEMEKWFIDNNYNINKFCPIDTIFTPK